MTAPMPMPRLREPACEGADPDLFFPEGEGPEVGKRIAQAKLICAGCPVRQRCLEFALVTRQTYGIWGGMTEDERRNFGRGVIDLTDRDQVPAPSRRL